MTSKRADLLKFAQRNLSTLKRVPVPQDPPNPYGYQRSRVRRYERYQ